MHDHSIPVPAAAAPRRHFRLRRSATVEERFWSKVQKSDDPDACWIWLAGKDEAGYGAFKMDRQVGAHTASYTLTKGPIPNGMVVMHSCDNPSCVRPEHLILGTYADNHHDAQRKGRKPTAQARPSSSHFNRGRFNGSAKLSEEQVREIRRRAANGEPRKLLAEEFGISVQATDRVVTRQSWTYLE